MKEDVIAKPSGNAAPAPDARAPGEPRQVLLFSGHMVDAPDRPAPRFPPSAVPLAAREIAAALDGFSAGPGDLALAQAAAGGDLLFLEACLQRGLHCTVLLPFAEDEFVRRSILPSAGGADWERRFRAIRPALELREMPAELGPTPATENPFERCNLWLLDRALAYGAQRLRFVCLWNGAGGDAPGGTAHMVGEVMRRGAPVVRIDPTGW